MKSGFVGIIGRSNVGKSTLINNLVGRKVAITSDKVQTTRNVIQGIYNDSESQIVFVDTPGIHKPTHKLGNYLNKEAYFSIEDVDVILFVVDGSVNIGPVEKFVIEKLKSVKKDVILVINKIDKMTNEYIMKKILEYKELYDFKEIVPVSALKNKNKDELIKVIKLYLKDNIKYYDDETFTNKPVQFLVSELIREKIFNLTREEIPHSVTVVIEQMKRNKGKLIINAMIVVDRDAVKKIIVGHNGFMIKQIGIEARQDIEELLGEKIYLELFVKTIDSWRDIDKYIKEFGYNEIDE